MRIVTRILIVFWFVLLQSRGYADVITFDFENIGATALPRSGSLSTLSQSRAGLTVNITRPGSVFDIISNTGSQIKPSNWGSRSLDPFFNTSASPFIFTFSSPVDRVSFNFGDYGQDSPDTLRVTAYSGPNATGTELRTRSYQLYTDPRRPDRFNQLSATVNAADILSVRIIGGTTAFPHSVFYDNVSVLVEPPTPQELAKSLQVVRLYADTIETLATALPLLGPSSSLCAVGVLPACAVVVVAAAAFGAPLAWDLGQILNDPPDLNYGTVYEIPPISPPIVTPDSGLPSLLVNLANETFAQQSRFVSLVRAWRVTLERLNAALLAGDLVAADLQRRALQEFVFEASQTADRTRLLLQELIPLLEALTGPIPIDMAQIEEAISLLSIEGFGPNERLIFQNLGITPEEIQEITTALLNINLEFDAVDPYFALRQQAQAMAEFAEFTRCGLDECGTAIPEPSSLALLSLGLACLASAARRRRVVITRRGAVLEPSRP